jgi:hypothetical protein
MTKFTEAARQQYALFRAKKRAQWETISAATYLPGIQQGENASEDTARWMIGYSSLDGSLEEHVVYGQLEKIEEEHHGPPAARVIRDRRVDKKSLTGKPIDLDDSQLASIINCWKAGRSALTLPFVEFVYVAGKIKTK